MKKSILLLLLLYCSLANASAAGSADRADINDDWIVDLADFIILASQWRHPPGTPSADIAPPDGDNMVDANDLALLAENWLVEIIWWEYPECWDCPTQCYGDSDCDGDVDTVDTDAFRDAIGYEPCVDFNRDGVLDSLDAYILTENFGSSPPVNCQPGDINEIYKP